MTTLDSATSPETVANSMATIPDSLGSQGLSHVSGYYGGSGAGDYYNYPYYYNTYQCGKCGMWVTGFHNCQPVVVYPTVVSYPVYIPQPTDLTPLLEKLDELNEEIKKLRKQNKKAIDKA